MLDKEYKEQLRKAEIKIGGLEDGAAAAQAKLATLESIKEYSRDLQSRLAFAEHQVDSRRSESGGLRDQMAGTRRLLEESKQYPYLKMGKLVIQFYPTSRSQNINCPILYFPVCFRVQNAFLSSDLFGPLNYLTDM